MAKVPYDLERRLIYADPPFPDAEYEERIARVRAAMAAAGLDALIVYANVASYANVMYLGGLEPVHGNAFVVLKADGGMAAAMDGMLHCEPMHSMVWTCRIADLRVALGPLYGDPPEKAALLAADAAHGAKRVGLAGLASMPAKLHQALTGVFPDAVPADAIMTEARLIKSPAEIALLRRAGAIADEAFAAIFATIGEGVEDFAVAAAAVGRMRALGATEAFETCVVAGPPVGLKHGYPRHRKLAAGDMVFLDLGANYRGYRSDVSRCTVIGPASGDARDLLELGLDLYHAGLAEIRPGRPVKEVAAALEKKASASRFARHFYPEGFGHGVGLDLFEGPGGLFNGSTAVFKPGMTVAYEPMVVVEGLGTGVVEDTLLITETGVERLNHYEVRTWS